VYQLDENRSSVNEASKAAISLLFSHRGYRMWRSGVNDIHSPTSQAGALVAPQNVIKVAVLYVGPNSSQRMAFIFAALSGWVWLL
jgi:hypothetical protein